MFGIMAMIMNLEDLIKILTGYGEMLMWGQADTAKAWWQMEQAVTAGLMMYNITGESQYLQMADETLKFFMTYFVDHRVWGSLF